MSDLINTASGAKFFMCVTPNPVLSNPAVAADYTGKTWLQVKGVQSIGNIGRTKKTVPFTALEDGEERIYPGVDQAITTTFACGKDSSDAGQVAMKAAQRTKFRYPFKVELADAPEADFSNTVLYFTGFVIKDDDAVGSDTSVVMTSFDVTTRSSSLVEVAPHVVT
jgi:hypothetical protein